MSSRQATLMFLLICLAVLAAAQETSQPATVSSAEMSGLLVKKVAPVYPPLARQARIQGTVILVIIISKSGDVQNPQLISGHPMLAPAAIEAVKQWKYHPYTSNGEPVEVKTSVQVNFTLSDKPPEGAAADMPGGAAPSGSEQRVRVSESVMRRMRIQQIDATYPPAALKAKVEGRVVLNAYISSSGDVERLELISGHPMLVAATIDAVKQWKYKPFLLNGEPTEVQTIVRVNFTLSREKEGEGSATDSLIAIDSEPAPGTSALPKRIRVSSGVSQGLLESKVNPEYPPDAREQHIQGVVLLQVKIDTEGNVVQVELISGHPLLAPAAMDAVRQWKYRPYLLNGTPVMVETQVQVNFTLAE